MVIGYLSSTCVQIIESALKVFGNPKITIIFAALLAI